MSYDINSFLNQSDEDAAAAAQALRDGLLKENQRNFDYSTFSITKIKPGSSALVRFLPNGIDDETDPNRFWVEKKMLQLQFIDPTDDTKLVKLNVPVAEMYTTDKAVKCITLEPARQLYKQADELKAQGKEQEMKRIKSLASKHWITYTYLTQGFVIKPGFEEENIPANPIRVFELKKTLFGIVLVGVNPPKGEEESALKYIPTHPKLGTNFYIRKTVKNAPGGAQNSYETSGWAREPSALTPDQISALTEFGLHDLRSRLPKRPTDDEYALVRDMVLTSIDNMGNAMWNPEWEAGLTTIKPFKVAANEKDKGRSTGGDIASEVQSTLADTPRPASNVSSLRRAPAAVQAEPAETEDDRPVEAEAPVAAPAPAASRSAQTDLAARIRAQMGSKK